MNLRSLAASSLLALLGAAAPVLADDYATCYQGRLGCMGACGGFWRCHQGCQADFEKCVGAGAVDREVRRGDLRAPVAKNTAPADKLEAVDPILSENAIPSDKLHCSDDYNRCADACGRDWSSDKTWFCHGRCDDDFMDCIRVGAADREIRRGDLRARAAESTAPVDKLEAADPILSENAIPSDKLHCSDDYNGCADACGRDWSSDKTWFCHGRCDDDFMHCIRVGAADREIRRGDLRAHAAESPAPADELEAENAAPKTDNADLKEENSLSWISSDKLHCSDAFSACYSACGQDWTSDESWICRGDCRDDFRNCNRAGADGPEIRRGDLRAHAAKNAAPADKLGPENAALKTEDVHLKEENAVLKAAMAAPSASALAAGHGLGYVPRHPHDDRGWWGGGGDTDASESSDYDYY